MREITGDLLALNDDDADFIAHQCNCLTVRSHGLSTSIFAKYPEANDYSCRRPVVAGRNTAVKDNRGTPGTAHFVGYVVNLFGQWRPGRVNSRYWNRYAESVPVETQEQRLKWFKMCLKHVASVVAEKDRRVTVAFPYGIGSGLAGGNWNDYRFALQEFDALHKHVDVLIVKLA